jgi:hypothetical protein
MFVESAGNKNLAPIGAKSISAPRSGFVEGGNSKTSRCRRSMHRPGQHVGDNDLRDVRSL